MDARTSMDGPPAAGTTGPLPRFSNTAAKVVALGAAQCAVYSFPVIFAIVCARNLGPSQYGTVAFYTALTAFLCMLVEFGFDSIGVREVHSARWRARPMQVLWNVTFAKLLICLPTCALVLPILLATRNPAEGPMSYAMVFYMLAFALEPSWYLRSLELMWAAACVAIVSRIAGVVLLLRTVTTHDDLTLAMWVYAFVAWSGAVAGWLVMRHLRLLGRPRIDMQQLRALFRSGGTVVIGNLSVASVANGGIAVLGAVGDPVVTGAANIALRVRAAGLAILTPLGQLGYVRLSALMAEPGAAVRFGRSLFYMLMACSVAVGLLVSFHAEEIAGFAYGTAHTPAAAVTMTALVGLGLPVCMAGMLFGNQCLVLFHRERAYVLIALLSAALFFGLLLWFDPRSPTGFGWALLASDAWVAFAAGVGLRAIARRHAGS
ncbi:oligosaccharide flippase family protein [Ramlibacter algicola]|uniref:Oligosaccharide flippase family protein n=1 Tax=Ramlibacter algicola TaxID=2795217 RepID=A0A934UQC5_9BURK|nr:oligosaccharide flippase family protein [Ramlibacter algicola]MBK0391676.1 oligosaccharide flippase family protein [Ramlibacter algicola]